MKQLYTLLIAILSTFPAFAQLVSGNAFLQGNYVEVGMAPCGSFGTTVNSPAGYHPRTNIANNTAMGFVADADRDGWTTGTPGYVGDFFLPGVPEEGWGITMNGVNYNNNLRCGAATNQITGTITNYNVTANEVSATWTGTLNGMTIEAKTYIPLTSTYFITEVTLSNTTAATLYNLYYMRNVDPDQGSSTPGGGGASTLNTIVFQNPNIANKALASAVTLQGNYYLGLGTADSRARVAHGGFSNRSPIEVWTGSGTMLQTGATTGDRAIAVAFKIDSLVAGGCTKFAYAYILSTSQLDAALAATSIEFNVAGIPYLSGSTVDVCSNLPVPLTLSNTGIYTNWNWTPAAGLNVTTGTSVIATVTTPTTYVATGTSACGLTSVNITLNPITVLPPSAAGPITGAPAMFAGSTGNTYSVAPVTGATFYDWTLPPGAIITSANAHGPTITFNAPTTSWCGPITVVPRNPCGSGPSASLYVCVGNLTTNSITGPLCIGAIVPIAYTANNATGLFLAGNVFTAQLSDALGSFAAPVAIGSVTSVTSGIITATIPASAINGTLYRIRVVSSTPAFTGADNGADIVISNNAAGAPGVTVTPPAATICTGVASTFTAVPTLGGPTPGYQWKKNNINVGTGSATYTDASLVNGDVITVVMTSSSTCVSPNSATSTPLTLAVTTSVTPTAAVSSNPVSPICSGTSITFTAASANGGPAPGYQWQINGVNAGTNANTFTTTTLANNDKVKVILTSNATCRTKDTASSNQLTIVVNNSPAVPGVISGNTTVCSGSSQTYSVPTVPGASSYSWTLPSGWSGASATNSITATPGTSSGNIVVTAINTCGNTTATLAVTALQVPVMPGAINGDDGACIGSSQTYSVTPMPGVSSYTWSLPPGWTGTSTTSSINCIAGSPGTVTVTGNNLCGTGPARSFVVNTGTPLVASVTIASNTTLYCSGLPVVFTATPVNGGTNPSYQWKVNSLPVGTNVPVYGTSVLANNDVVLVEMRSSEPCLVKEVVSSNIIEIPMNPSTTASVTITANPGVNIGPGQFVTFTAAPVNGGITPAYQWFKNGTAIPGAINAIWTGYSLAAGDVISVRMTQAQACATPLIVNSNTLTINMGTSITTISNGIGMTMYPNPNSGNFTLEVMGMDYKQGTVAIIDVVNMLGQIVYSKEVKPAGKEWKAELILGKAIANGIYNLRVSYGESHGAKRFELIR